MGLAVVAACHREQQGHAEDECSLGRPWSGSPNCHYLLILGQEPRGLGAILGLALLICKMAGRLISSSETGERNS